MIGRWILLVTLVVVLGGCAGAPATAPLDDAGLDDLAQGLRDTQLAAIDTAVTQNDLAAARPAFDEFQTAWAAIESNVATAAPAVRETIAEAVTTLEAQLDASSLDATAVNATLDQVRAGLASLAGE